jgi:hypothetical protein
MVESMLAGLKRVPGLEGPLSGEIWDQGDAGTERKAEIQLRCNLWIALWFACKACVYRRVFQVGLHCSRDEP